MDRFLRHKPLFTLSIIGVALFVQSVVVLPPPLSKEPASVLMAVTTASSTDEFSASVPEKLSQYIEVLDSCGSDFGGNPCVNMRSGPGLEYSVLKKLRNGIVFKVADTITTIEGRVWYKIGYDGDIRYPERIEGSWYVAADQVHSFFDRGLVTTTAGVNASSTKRIVIDLSQEELRAYDADALFLQQPISAGLDLTPTPKGLFWVYKKTPDSYMQGPLPGISDQYYDLPGVPWDLYFTEDGGAIHGAYWHSHFGQQWSHGCVNMVPDQAKRLYEWADLGTLVIVQD
ncbi:MAG: L,D-transpeptidase family protein [Minisyncoccia bacterium]